jgi:hypothetical protein
MKKVHIFGGGTVAHISSHFAVSAPAYGRTALDLNLLAKNRFAKDSVTIHTHLTKMAGGDLETNADIAAKIEELKKDSDTKMIFFSPALVDFEPSLLSIIKKGATIFDNRRPIDQFGKYEARLNTRDLDSLHLMLTPTEKIISKIRDERKDIFLVGFKTTCGATKQEMYEKGLHLCKTGSVNLVLVNDVKTRWNMIVTPEEASYHETQEREHVLKELVDMAYLRSHLTFTQSTVIEGKPVAWDSPEVPDALRKVVDYCIGGKAYKPFNGSTVGHFAVKLSDTEFLTSIRRSNFNDLQKTGLVRIKTDGPDTVLAYGAKPSVGGQSQRIVFKDHPGLDCIVHFHSPLKQKHRDPIMVISQRDYECGSHQCGQRTSRYLSKFGNLYAVMLDNHGPNIVFSKDINPKEVIDFIDANFDLHEKTGGYNV